MCAIEYYTYDDYIKWEGNWELINGMPLAMSPAPMITHQAIANFIANELTNSLLKQGLWTKALADSNWNEPQAKALYVKMR